MGFFGEIISGFGSIFSSPFKSASALWLLVPLFIIWIALTVYYWMHPDDTLSWDTALGHAVTMFWVFIDLFAKLFDKSPFEWGKFFVLLVFFSYSIFIAVACFRHSISSEMVSILISPTVLFFVCWVSVVWVFGSLGMSLAVLIDLIVLLAIFVGITEGIKWYRKKNAPLKEEEEKEEVPEEEPEEEEPEEPKKKGK